jgi:uncharacterized protein YaiL (DUF2058 family)
MPSLQDQLLKAGLVDEKKAKQVNKEKRKEKKQQPKGHKPVDASKLAAKKSLEQKAERAREENRKQQEQAEKKAINAQIVQLIKMNKLGNIKGDIGYNFTDGNVKKIYVNKDIQDKLSEGKLAIVKLVTGNETQYEIVAPAVAEKIAQRDESIVVSLHAKTTETKSNSEEEDWYADYEIPDDLMW